MNIIAKLGIMNKELSEKNLGEDTWINPVTEHKLYLNDIALLIKA